MNLPYRIDLLVRLGEYILSNEEPWKQVKEKAGHENGWFIPEFVDLALQNITRSFLQKKILTDWSHSYQLQTSNVQPRRIGIVMAGNIPLVGFHDLLCVFISGHKAMIKLSSKDKLLIKHLTEKLSEWSVRTPSEAAEINNLIQFSEMLKGC